MSLHRLGTIGWRWLTRSLGLLLIAVVRCYQAGISPLLVGSCKYVPSCSEYMAVAVGRHGPWRGGWMGVRRLLRCHPLSVGGYDPVPPGDVAGAGVSGTGQRGSDSEC